MNSSATVSSALAVRFGQPKSLFQVIGLVACAAAFVAHLQELAVSAPSTAHLTIGNQELLVRLFSAVLPDAGFLAGVPFAALMFLAFATALLVVTSPSHRSGRMTVLLLSLQLLIGTLVNNDLLLLLAAQYPLVYRPGRALVWLLLQSLAITAAWLLVLAIAEPSLTLAIRSEMASAIASSLLMFFAWQLFAFFLGYIAMSERAHRDRLAIVNAELLATQQLLDNSARSSERLRIARDLHDALGHHLTALGLHLDLTMRQTPQMQSASLHTARNIARDLLGEVRAAVGREREDTPIDLEQSLRILGEGIPGLEVRFDWEPGCRFSDAAQAHAAFRAVQEAISNALRHADATELVIAVRREDDGIRVEIEDDGRGTGDVQPGNGLCGMRERIEAGGGLLELRSLPGAGFGASFWLPAQRAAS